MTEYLKLLWTHECIRSRPGMYLGAVEEPREQARGLVRWAVKTLRATLEPYHTSGLRLQIWRGEAFEIVCEGGGLPADLPPDTAGRMSRVDLLMTDLTPAWHQDEQRWMPMIGFGPVLNALSSRVLIQSTWEGVGWESWYSRGGVLAPTRPSDGRFEGRTRVVFELDPLVFDPAARAFAADPDGLLDLLPGEVSLHPMGASEILYDPW